MGEKIMTKDIWVISDTHFNHANILNFVDSRTGFPVRPGFTDVDHMNEFMIEMWNQRVKPGDKVYHLGDVFMGDKEAFKTLWPRLNGSKNLIVGNHDDIKFLASGGFFKKVQMWRQFTEYNLLLSHVPLHEMSASRGRPDAQKLMVNIHGHIHQNPSPPGRYINVCVEAIEYTPVHIETLAAKAKKMLDQG
jgi:calcineurin-like phosphoesterase family protein